MSEQDTEQGCECQEEIDSLRERIEELEEQEIVIEQNMNWPEAAVRIVFIILITTIIWRACSL